MQQDPQLFAFISDLLIIELQASQVFASYMRHGEDFEKEFWFNMFQDEISHVQYVSEALQDESLCGLGQDALKAKAFTDIAFRALQMAKISPQERALWALRLEHAEIDFGIELEITRLLNASSAIGIEDISRQHYMRLIDWARQFEHESAIRIQIARIEEHLPTEPTEVPPKKEIT